MAFLKIRVFCDQFGPWTFLIQRSWLVNSLCRSRRMLVVSKCISAFDEREFGDRS